ncbi:carbohydrate-binding protein [Streptomyces pluripotens]|uniref:Carbohydrate-binding protein n=1 Tax=Streptomyces pluripotens TaxID=1355015 RepID=A0A221P0Q4_9ACTN|nr:MULTISPECIES: carbohydrate-binding protein [Streptomyces]ARP71551.1 carbohydrate-binding protein [Streptomyces pluripotens]ASN25801.1 carbohydrate-binding protein [Streptomyces pluripotens]KIE25108.1 carbohydrate-binding protein [Streptomyces sp. MUSC 125]MCH0557471.1 carbohydrate-binding protein [Streptomyces sp. MUM 16J]
MTPGDNGASTPEDDDPFGYLYADGQARGAQPPSGGYGYPNSVSRVRTVGERQYGQPQAPHGQPSVPQQQGAYGQPNAHYQAPETLSGGPAGRQSAPPPGAGGRSGPNTKGLLIGAVAVVAAVVIGIGVAVFNGNSGDGTSGNQADTTPAQSQNPSPSPSGSDSAQPGELPKADGSDKGLQLAGGAGVASDVSGARSADGSYVGGLNQVGASVTWTVNDLPEDGPYTLFVNYSAAGSDQSMSVTINGKPFGSKLGLKNYRSAADGDFAKGWTTSYVWPTLKKGPNTISISCQPGDKCNVLIDQLWIKKGHVKRNG